MKEIKIMDKINVFREEKDILCWNTMSKEDKAKFMYELRINCPVLG